MQRAGSSGGRGECDISGAGRLGLEEAARLSCAVHTSPGGGRRPGQAAGMSAKERPKGKVIKDSVTLLPCFYFVELPILASSVVSLYFLELTDVFKPVHSGFSCYDRSLSMPYIEPTQEAIPFLMLLSLAFAGPAITIMVGEGILYCCLSKRRNGVGLEPNINAGGCNFNSFLRRAVRFVGVHVFGLCSTALITDIIQLSTGYQAPYFLTVCKPNYTSLNVSCKENSYIVEDICSGSDLTVINSGRKSFPSQHATLAAFAAVYVSGLYAVGNFLPSDESMFQHRDALRSLTDLNQDPNRVLSAKNGSSSDGIAHTEGILNRNHRDASSLTNLKRANADVEIITPRSPMGKENMVTFSNTLPRANTPSVEDPVRRNASIHASMDSARSKQLLTQWKNKNESRKLSLQVIEPEPGQSPPRSIEMRSSSEPSRVGVNGDHHGPGNQYLKIQPGAVPGCNNSMPGGPRVSIQSRPGSSQLVHIPEETQENISTSPKSSSARAKWLKAAEKTVACNRSNSQPRIMQVIAMSKQQGVLQSSPKNTEGSTVSCTGSIRYKTLTDHEPSGIVRVEAHPENNRPIIQIPSTEGEGSGSWKWKAPEKGSLRQTYELNDLNRDSESCESLKDSFGSGDRKRSNIDSNEHHHHGITTIRVTPVEGSEIGSETLSISSSRDSTLRRKGNIILIPERSNSPENTRNIFYKGTSPTRAYKD
ncbi:phospholipid phosphatase-related protein type 4 isoform X2 [Piliocolobus tephrosceles]|uniref:Phospholipid phosphatase related 4 n=6 Tax=Catarrhini TaxID=9526 RepID=A0A2K6M9Z7_RHIBE|nr:phospholipid phosphatase-related protein type 4 isoform X2 [Rhinopithecus roxellana]XP_011814803.1 PREDICTED: lipid phosphate phosphatase-related protein type 4 isoform X2 [Colobus angolensis palliatus]XP_023086820.1 phospholipid phosphatase-related protein type 4 isoform X2 [Piliocolobus tephrosceles]